MKRQREIKKEKGGMTGWRRVRERYRKRKEDKTKIIGRERDRKRKRKGERERGGEKKNDRMGISPGGVPCRGNIPSLESESYEYFMILLCDEPFYARNLTRFFLHIVCIMYICSAWSEKGRVYRTNKFLF